MNVYVTHPFINSFQKTTELLPDAACLKVSPYVHDLPESVMNNDIAIKNEYETPGDKKSLMTLHCWQQKSTDSINVELEDLDVREEMKQDLRPEAIQKKRGRRPNSLRKEEEGYDPSWIIGVKSSLDIPCRIKNSKRKTNTQSKSLDFEESASPSEPGKKTQLLLSATNAHGKSMTALLSQNHGLPDRISPRLHQKRKIESLMNQDSGLDLLSVSAGNLLRTQDDEKASEGSSATLRKESDITADAKTKRRRGLWNKSSESTKDGKSKGKRAPGKNISERNGDSKEKIRWDFFKNVPPKTEEICSDFERKQELPVCQIDNLPHRVGITAPVIHATQKPADGIVYIEASKVKNRRKPALPKKEVLLYHNLGLLYAICMKHFL